jgi:hypothetical protein
MEGPRPLNLLYRLHLPKIQHRIPALTEIAIAIAPAITTEPVLVAGITEVGLVAAITEVELVATIEIIQATTALGVHLKPKGIQWTTSLATILMTK